MITLESLGSQGVDISRINTLISCRLRHFNVSGLGALKWVGILSISFSGNSLDDRLDIIVPYNSGDYR